MGPALYGHSAGLDAQGLVQGNGPKIMDSHLRGDGGDAVEFVDLAHGIIEDGGNNSSVTMAGRTGVTVVELEAAEVSVASLVGDEF